MQIETIETPSLGNRGYLVHDGKVAIAIDVQRDFERWTSAADKAGVTITHVLETHMHNDYVTGGYQLAKQQPDITYCIPAEADVWFDGQAMKDGDKLKVGAMDVVALHTPGHTEHHTSYHISDGNYNALFSGGGILFGTVGRTDLVAKEKTRQLTEAQYESAIRVGEDLPESTRIMPTHGFGSFCSSSDGSGVDQSTLKMEKQNNIAFTHSKQEFIEAIIAGLGPYPRYYAHMGPMNQAGPGAVKQLHVHEYSTQAIADKLNSKNTWVIDIRNRKAFAANHPEGAVGIELGDSFATYSGWILPWGDELVLVGDNQDELKRAYTGLSRIGMDSQVSGATDKLDSYLTAGTKNAYQIRTFEDLRNQAVQPFILDVRLPANWYTSHIEGSVNIPLHELIERVDELPTGEPIWIHCMSGYRASIGASLLERAGKTPVLIDDLYERANK